MPQVINTNVASLNAQRNLNTSQTSLATSLQRLSSGLRINSAKDDAAGLAISDRMTSQIRGLNQAIRNSNDGISLAQTAEGALAQSSNALQRIRELAIQSANASNVATDRKSLNAEAQQLLAEMQRIATSTQFNGQNIIDGTFNSAQFQVGANANQIISAGVGNAQTSALGAYQYNNTATAVSGQALATGDLTINGVNVGATSSGGADTIVTAINAISNQTSVSATATTTLASGSAPTGKVDLQAGDLVINGVDIGAVGGSYNVATQGAAIASAINNKSNSTGVSATANAVTGAITLTSSTGKTIDVTSSGAAGASRTENATGLELSGTAANQFATNALTLNGTRGTGVSTLTMGATAATNNGQTFKVNDVTFELQDTGTNGAVVGGNTIIGGFTNQATLISQAIAAINGANGAAGAHASSTGGTNLTVTSNMVGIETDQASELTQGTALGAVTNTLGTGIAEGDKVTVGGVEYTFVKGATSGNSISLTSAGTVTEANAKTATQTAFAAQINANHTAKLTNVQAGAVAGAAFTVTSDLNGAAGNSSIDATGTGAVAGRMGEVITSKADGAYTANTARGVISLSSTGTFQIGGNNPSKAGLSTASSTLNAISTIDISSVQGANTAISLIDGALSQLNSTRGDLGALQNRFETTVANLQTTAENLTSARSRIMDTDFASETASLTRAQILQQAGTAMLAQANALPNQVLSLLRG